MEQLSREDMYQLFKTMYGEELSWEEFEQLYQKGIDNEEPLSREEIDLLIEAINNAGLSREQENSVALNRRTASYEAEPAVYKKLRNEDKLQKEDLMDVSEYINRATAFFQEGKIGPAIENFEEALKLQPGNADLRQMIEMLKMQNKNLANEDQASVNEAKHRAQILGIAVADVDKAIAEFTEALKRNPDDASAKNSLASAYYIRGLTFTSKREHARAVEDYSEAIKNNPDYPLAFNKRGWANLEIGNFDQAIADFEKVIQFNPDDASKKQNLARAYMERGIAYDKKSDYAHAIPDFEMVLKFEPDNSTARELLEMAKAEMAKAK